MEDIEESLLTEKKSKQLIFWRIATIVLLILLIAISILYGFGVGWKKEEKKEEELTPTENLLTLWKESETKKKIINYVKSVTDKSSSKYIPPEYRIVVSDFDGTLFCETDPIYFDYYMFSYRVLNDTNYKDLATEEEKQLAIDIASADIHNLRPDLQMRHCNSYPQVYENMTFEELEEYTKNYMQLEALGFDNMKRGEGFYEPMLELIEYLQANEFQFYICSGGDRHIYRTLARSRINIPEGNIMATIQTVVARGQTNRSDPNYEYKRDDELIVGGEFKLKNVKMNKVSVIKTELGRQPVISIGNSGGDYSMARYVTSNKNYESMAIMILCDDEENEYGNMRVANNMETKCKDEGWVAVSMKNDWERIYNEGVRKKPSRD